MDQTAHTDSDPLLAPLMEAGNVDVRREALADLLTEHAYERIDKILTSRLLQSSLSSDLRDDIRNEIVVKLVNRLSQLADDGKRGTIASFPDYVAVVAFNTFDEFVRRAFPLRAKLKNRIRYVLSHDPRFAVWESDGAATCGLSSWLGRTASPRNAQQKPDAVPSTGPDLAATLFDTFERLQEPLLLEDLVARLSAAHHIPAHEEALRIEERGIAAPAHDPIAELESLQYMRSLWAEICELPLRQRVALLLHARDFDGESVTRFLPVSGVATIRQISEVLGLGANEFAELWKDLPLEDTKIAVMLQLTRQQVINLRRSARDRLKRRMTAGGQRERGKK